MRKRGESLVVSWCFKPSQPQTVISGLRVTSIKKCIAERTDKAEIRPEEKSEKVGSCQEMQLRGP